MLNKLIDNLAKNIEQQATTVFMFGEDKELEQLERVQMSLAKMQGKTVFFSRLKGEYITLHKPLSWMGKMYMELRVLSQKSYRLWLENNYDEVYYKRYYELVMECVRCKKWLSWEELDYIEYELDCV